MWRLRWQTNIQRINFSQIIIPCLVVSIKSINSIGRHSIERCFCGCEIWNSNWTHLRIYHRQILIRKICATSKETNKRRSQSIEWLKNIYSSLCCHSKWIYGIFMFPFRSECILWSERHIVAMPTHRGPKTEHVSKCTILEHRTGHTDVICGRAPSKSKCNRERFYVRMCWYAWAMESCE